MDEGKPYLVFKEFLDFVVSSLHAFKHADEKSGKEQSSQSQRLGHVIEGKKKNTKDSSASEKMVPKPALLPLKTKGKYNVYAVSKLTLYTNVKKLQQCL